MQAGLYGKEPQTAPGEPHPHPHWGETIPLPTLSLPFKSQGYPTLPLKEVASTSRLTLGSVMPSGVDVCGIFFLHHIGNVPAKLCLGLTKTKLS